MHAVDLCNGTLALFNRPVSVLALVHADEFALLVQHVRNVNELVGHEPLALIFLFDEVQFRR